MTNKKVVYTVRVTLSGARVSRELFDNGEAVREHGRYFKNTIYGQAKYKIDKWIHDDISSMISAGIDPMPEIEVIGHTLSKPAIDPAELRKAAMYALKVFEGHCNSNLHSLGCACALSWLKRVLEEPLTAEDKQNLQSINVQVTQT